MSHSTQSSKTASEVIKEMYLYFQNNTIQEVMMDCLIIALPLILAYSIARQIKRVKQGGLK